MDFNTYKSNINMIQSCEPCDGWTFDRIITLFQDVVLKLDNIQVHVDEAVDKIEGKL